MERKRLLAIVGVTVLVAAVPSLAWAGPLDGITDTVDKVVSGDGDTSDGSGGGDKNKDDGGVLDSTTKTVEKTVDNVTNGDDGGGDDNDKGPATSGTPEDDGSGSSAEDSGSKDDGPSGTVTKASTGGPQGVSVAPGIIAGGPISTGGTSSGLSFDAGSAAIDVPGLDDLPAPSVADPAVDGPDTTLAVPATGGSGSEEPTLPVLVAGGLIAAAMVAWKVAWDQREALRA